MISNLNINAVFSKVMPKHIVVSVQDNSKGQVNKIYFVKLAEKYTGAIEEFVLRIYPKDGWKAEKEKYLFDLVRQKTDVPVPEMIVSFTGKNILGYPYSILKKIDGNELGTRITNRSVTESGTMLAKIHSIKFDRFGWIVGQEIKPKFEKWADFLEFDLKHKIKKAGKSLPKKTFDDIRKYFDDHKALLDDVVMPSLLHKDYSYAHIICDKNINGIIDWEWAISGHNEFDLVKSILWMFENDKKLENLFLRGYKKEAVLSNDFEKRRKLYEMLIYFNSFVFSRECSSGKWCRYNLSKLKRLLYGKSC
ncbi:MAG: aminoglycoside phosphotransferase family protein [Nanoarchaeota archaeon]|nr:aminoglycoside phosphotransferase family protein [Nanoarchaeota archaeon]MBU1704739.1 aminoglycoside phosphotransferase family protein [Nanoarchaeota archaeon]